MDEPIDPASPSPPPPPVVTFEPPLYLQRRRAVHELLRQLSTSPLFGNKRCKSVLDVGCGTDLLLLRSLIPCEDDLPLEHVTGIDMDDGLLSDGLIDSLAPGHDEEEARWREITVRLLHGSFEQLSPEVVPRHDAIVSSEVIEHLDPIPLANYAPVLLGKMRPKVCIVTTPNRDFNKIFDHALPHDPTRRYFRPDVPYAMRHHDHRFEWTRAEFRTWAKEAAEKWGYRVVFAGVGSLDCGVVCDDSRVRDYVCNNTDEFIEDPGDHYSSIPAKMGAQLGFGLRDLLGDLFLPPSYLSHSRKVIGPCSQIAIFMLQEPEPGTAPDEVVFSEHWNALPTNDLKLVCQHAYPWAKNEVYPPPYPKVLELVQATFAGFMPELVAGFWDHIGKPFLRPEWGPSSYQRYCDSYEDIDLLDARSPQLLQERELAREEAEGKEYERLEIIESIMGGMHVEDVDVVRVAFGPHEVWRRSYALQRAFRFNYTEFWEIFMTSGKQGIMGLSAQNSNGDASAGAGANSNTKWKTIHTTPTTLQLYNHRLHGSGKLALVKLTINDPKNPPVSVTRIPSAQGMLSLRENTPPLEETSPTEEAPLPEASLPEETFLEEVSLPEGSSLLEEASPSGEASLPVTSYEPLHVGAGLDMSGSPTVFEASSTCGGSVHSEPQEYPPKLHTVAVWALDYCNLDEKNMDVEVPDEKRMLRIENKPIRLFDGRIMLTFFKPEEKDMWGGLPVNGEIDYEQGKHEHDYEEGNSEWWEPSGSEIGNECATCSEESDSWGTSAPCHHGNQWVYN